MAGQGRLDTDKDGWKGLDEQKWLDRDGWAVKGRTLTGMARKDWLDMEGWTGIAEQRRLNTDRDGWTEKAEHSQG